MPTSPKWKRARARKALSGPSRKCVGILWSARSAGIPIALQVRSLTADELDTVRHLAHSRTAAARAVERARIIWFSHQGWRVPAIAREVGLDGDTVRLWLKRFDADVAD